MPIKATDYAYQNSLVSPPNVSLSSIGDKIKVFWPFLNQHNPSVTKSITEPGQYVIENKNDNMRTLEKLKEPWKTCNKVLAAETFATSLTSNVSTVLYQIFDIFKQIYYFITFIPSLCLS